MANAAFDTLTVSKELQDAGIEARQAEAIALAVKQGQGDLATKQDIALLKTELKSDITWLKWSMALMMAIMLGGFTLIASS